MVANLYYEKDRVALRGPNGYKGTVIEVVGSRVLVKFDFMPIPIGMEPKELRKLPPHEADKDG